MPDSLLEGSPKFWRGTGARTVGKVEEFFYAVFVRVLFVRTVLVCTSNPLNTFIKVVLCWRASLGLLAFCLELADAHELSTS